MALAENQSTGGVVLIGVVLLTIVLTALSVYKAAGVPVDGEVLLQQRFAYEELPYGLEVKEAHQVSGGDKLVRLGPPEGKAVPEGMPVRVVVMYHRKALGPKLKFSSSPHQPGPEKLMEWEEDPSKTFRTELSQRQVAFDVWESLVIRDRIYNDTGEWNDNMRVNLSTSELYVVLFADFAPGVVGTEEAFAELLEGMQLRPGHLEVAPPG